MNGEWRQLSNGMRLYMQPDTSNSIVALVIFEPTGAACEGPKDCGLLSFTGRLMQRGTRTMSSAQYAEAVETAGVSIGFDAADDYSFCHLSATRDDLAEGLRLFGDAFRAPSFEPEEIEKERQTTLAAIARKEDDKLGSTMRRFYRELYGDHGYGLPSLGLAESIKELTREQILAAHADWAVPQSLTGIAVGNFDPDELVQRLEHDFGPAAGDVSVNEITPPAPVANTGRRARLSRDCEQSYLVAGFPAPAMVDPVFPAVRVLNAILGDGMSSRLFTNLREKKGLAYATGSSYAAQRLGGQLFGYIGTKPESLDLARESMLAEFRQIVDEPVSAEELDRAKNYITGKFLIDHQTNYRRAFLLGHYNQLGLGLEFDEQYPERIMAVSAADVQAAAQQVLASEPTIAELVPE